MISDIHAGPTVGREEVSLCLEERMTPAAWLSLYQEESSLGSHVSGGETYSMTEVHRAQLAYRIG